jgi:hypothetical protein
MQRADELLTFLRKVSIILPAARASQPLTPAPDAASGGGAAVGLLTADRTADGKLGRKKLRRRARNIVSRRRLLLGP